MHRCTEGRRQSSPPKKAQLSKREREKERETERERERERELLRTPAQNFAYEGMEWEYLPEGLRHGGSSAEVVRSSALPSQKLQQKQQVQQRCSACQLAAEEHSVDDTAGNEGKSGWGNSGWSGHCHCEQ